MKRNTFNYGDERLPERFWSKCIPEPNSGCWLWFAGTIKDGYGSFKRGFGSILAHRIAYEALVGEIDAGMEIDHLCRQRCCVNPSHLEQVTPRENKRRGGRELLYLKCSNGHDRTPENTFRRGRCNLCRQCADERYMRIHGRLPRRRAK